MLFAGIILMTWSDSRAVLLILLSLILALITVISEDVNVCFMTVVRMRQIVSFPRPRLIGRKNVLSYIAGFWCSIILLLVFGASRMILARDHNLYDQKCHRIHMNDTVIKSYYENLTACDGHRTVNNGPNVVVHNDSLVGGFNNITTDYSALSGMKLLYLYAPIQITFGLSFILTILVSSD